MGKDTNELVIDRARTEAGSSARHPEGRDDRPHPEAGGTL